MASNLRNKIEIEYYAGVDIKYNLNFKYRKGV